MPILLACGGEGLKVLRDAWQTVPIPLHNASLLAAEGERVAVLDDEAHLLFTGEDVLPVDRGIEAVRLWQGRWLILSGDTDCLTLMDLHSGSPLYATPAGVYPQDLCVIPGEPLAAVCGGAEGSVRVLHLPSLRLQRTLRVPGNAQRIAFYGGWLYVLCAAEEDGLRCLMCRVPLRGGRYEPICTLPGLPGAIRSDTQGGLWVGASEALYHFPLGASQPDRTLLGQGLIRHIDLRGASVLTADPILGTLTLLDARGRTPPRILYEGDVRQGTFVEERGERRGRGTAF